MLERFFPNYYTDKVSDLKVEFFTERKIKGILIDIDNTLIDYYENITEDTLKWIEAIKQSGIKILLLSNNNKDRVSRIGERLGLEGIHYASKPRRRGYVLAMEKMKLKNHEVCMIGDQLFTDVYGGNRLNMFTILVNKVHERDIWITKFKRPLEKRIMTSYQKNDEEMAKRRDYWKRKSAISKKIQEKN